MQIINGILLVAHIIFGFVALAGGLVAMMAKKGLKAHKLSGKIFFVSMLIVALSAIGISLIKDIQFMLHIGIFTLFMDYFGYKAVSKRANRVGIFDVAVLVLSVVNAVVMLITLNVILVVFAVISLFLGVQETLIELKLKQQKKINRKQQLAHHLGMMIGAYIATVTAFLVVNIKGNVPYWIVWFLPTVLFVPVIVYWNIKLNAKRVGKVLLLFAVSGLSFATQAQPYVEGGKTRHRFAQLTVGADVRTYLGTGSQGVRLNNGVQETFELKNQNQARIIIGGTHFWGHADFYVSFAVANMGKSGFLENVETGAKLYPWRLKYNKLRPYIGTSLLTTTYQQGNGGSLVKLKAPLLLGLTYMKGNNLFDVGFGYHYDNTEQYYIDRTTQATIKTQPYSFTIGYRRMLETTLSAERDWKSGRTKLLTDTLVKLGRLNGFTFAIGPSSAFFLKKSAHNADVVPFIDDHKVIFVPFDVGVGYYIHKPDIQFNLAFRNYKSSLTAYGYTQTAKRTSLVFEAYKYLFDYHGFALFAGPAVGYEWLNVNDNSTTSTNQGIKPGITFGWDIRPNRLQAILLRTNLRYTPNLNVNMSSGKTVALDALEFNFIQVVIFPKRLF